MDYLGSVGIRIGADPGGLEKGVDKSRRSVGDLQRDITRMGANVARVGVRVTATVTAIAAAGGYAAKRAAEAGTEIARFSRIAGTSTTNFQRMAAGVATVGMQGGDLADTLKDVNEKFGEYMASGTGPLVDFFENIAPKVQVTAEQFAKLSGPEALQLYVDSLEKAGLTQQQMTFYMEALASEAVGLLPLLRNGGAEMKRLGDEAEAAGRIMDEKTVRSAEQLDRKLAALGTSVRTQINKALLENADDISALVDQMATVWLPALVEVANKVTEILNAAGKYAKIANSVFGGEDNASAQYSPEERARIATERDFSGLGGNGNTLTGTVNVNSKGEIEPYGIAGRPVSEEQGINTPSVSEIPLVNPDINSGSSGGRNYQTELDQLRDKLSSERELLQEEYQRQLDALAEFRTQKLASEAEFNELERRAAEDHAEALAALDRKVMQQKLSAFSGMFGDLATLMSSENEKLFKVGKVAAVAQATVDGLSAATSAWDKGMAIGGPPVAAGFAGASLLKTGALISSIQSTQIGGGTGATGGGASVGASPSVSPVQVSLDGIDPNKLYMGSSSRELLKSLSDEAGDAGLTFV